MLGILWVILNPLLSLALYVFVFGFVFGGSFNVVPNETRWDFGLGIFLGLALFNLVAESLSVAPIQIASNANLVKKAIFPLETLAPAAVGAALVQLAVSLAMILIGAAFGGDALTSSAFLLPIIILPIIAFSVGSVWILSALAVFYRDIAQIVGFLTSALLFASATFYPAASIPPPAWRILQFNPLIHTIESARDVVLWGKPIQWPYLGLTYAICFVVFFVGFALFGRLKATFADEL